MSSSLSGCPIHSALCHIKAKSFVNYLRPIIDHSGDRLLSIWTSPSHQSKELRKLLKADHCSFWQQIALGLDLSFGRPCCRGTDLAECVSVPGGYSFGLRGPSPQAFTPFGKVGLIARRLRRP